MEWLLRENRKTLTLNHEEALKSIHDKIGHVFGSLLKLWSHGAKRRNIYEENTPPKWDANSLMESFNII